MLRAHQTPVLFKSEAALPSAWRSQLHSGVTVHVLTALSPRSTWRVHFTLPNPNSWVSRLVYVPIQVEKLG